MKFEKYYLPLEAFVKHLYKYDNYFKGLFLSDNACSFIYCTFHSGNNSTKYTDLPPFD